MLIWKKILDAVQEFIPHNADGRISINTREEAAKLLIKLLDSIPLPINLSITHQ